MDCSVWNGNWLVWVAWDWLDHIMLCVSVWLWFLHEGLRDLLFLGCPFIIPYTYLTSFYLFTRGGDDEQAGDHSFFFSLSISSSLSLFFLFLVFFSHMTVTPGRCITVILIT